MILPKNSTLERHTRRNLPDPSSEPRTIRCAVYTRKSTEEGLDQEFNSLDAQRESAEAFIASQRHEGWLCLSERYDDGGFTGGNMERPALKRLLADIEAGEIDCVVVYKVDRLSRSLLDFSRIMETFDRRGVSFVSVTQQFNTTSSMGRLTLNILLSFAQFEREIISERTHDKMSAARRKGKWVGGAPVLGYDIAPNGGRLLVNDEEARQVRSIFELYLERQSLISVVKELEIRGWRTKRWINRKGVERGSKAFTKNNLYRLLTNIAYTGKVEYKGDIYDGEHGRIVDDELWERVQKALRHNGGTGGRDVRNKYGALLKGLLYCAPCSSGMMHSYTVKNGKRYRYYVCLNAQQRGWTSCPTKALNAHQIETAVVEHIRGIASNDEVFTRTLTKVQEQNQNRQKELDLETRSLEKELSRLQGRLKSSTRMANETDLRRSDRPERNLERTRAIEQRITSLREEMISLQRESVDEKEVARALSLFDPVWDSLSTLEKTRIVRLLVERVAYDGRDGGVTVTFRSPGIKALCLGDKKPFREN